MKTGHEDTGYVLLIVVLLAVLLAATVIGHLQINAEEIQVMQNQIGGAEALATAEAGLNDALAQLRSSSSWHAGYVNKAFNGGSYSVTVNGTTIRSTAVTATGFTGTMEAVVTLAAGGPPYLVRIDSLKINQ